MVSTSQSLILCDVVCAYPICGKRRTLFARDGTRGVSTVFHKPKSMNQDTWTPEHDTETQAQTTSDPKAVEAKHVWRQTCEGALLPYSKGGDCALGLALKLSLDISLTFNTRASSASNFQIQGCQGSKICLQASLGLRCGGLGSTATSEKPFSWVEGRRCARGQYCRHDELLRPSVRWTKFEGRLPQPRPWAHGVLREKPQISSHSESIIKKCEPVIIIAA